MMGFFSFPCKRANENHNVNNQKKQRSLPASNGSILQPEHISNSENCFLQGEEFHVKEAQRFLVLKGETTLAAGIISCSDLKNLPSHLLEEFKSKSWYYNHDLVGSYNEYQRLCVGKKSCTTYGNYHMRAWELERDVTCYRFFDLLKQTELDFERRDISLKINELRERFHAIDDSEINKSIYECYSYQKYQRLHEEKVDLLLQLWNEVALEKRDFYEVLHSIYNTMMASYPTMRLLLILELDENQPHRFLKKTFDDLCNHVRSATGSISKGEESDKKISEFFKMMKPELRFDYAKYIKAKIHMAMDLGIISENDLLAIYGGSKLLEEGIISKEGDVNVVCYCKICNPSPPQQN